jgi:hypothetical protein
MPTTAIDDCDPAQRRFLASWLGPLLRLPREQLGILGPYGEIPAALVRHTGARKDPHRERELARDEPDIEPKHVTDTRTYKIFVALREIFNQNEVFTEYGWAHCAELGERTPIIYARGRNLPKFILPRRMCWAEEGKPLIVDRFVEADDPTDARREDRGRGRDYDGFYAHESTGLRTAPGKWHECRHELLPRDRAVLSIPCDPERYADVMRARHTGGVICTQKSLAMGVGGTARDLNAVSDDAKGLAGDPKLQDSPTKRAKPATLRGPA